MPLAWSQASESVVLSGRKPGPTPEAPPAFLCRVAASPGQLGFSFLAACLLSVCLSVSVCDQRSWLALTEFSGLHLDAWTSEFRPVCYPEAKCRLSIGSDCRV